MILLLLPICLACLFGLLVLDACLVTTPPKKPHVPFELSEEEEAELFELPWTWEDTPLPKGDKT